MTEDDCFGFLLTNVPELRGFLLSLYSLDSYFLIKLSYSSFLKEYMRWVNLGKDLSASKISLTSLNKLLLISSSFNF